jgi:uncharacterized protein DUF4406/uncharacterized protein DUF6378
VTRSIFEDLANYNPYGCNNPDTCSWHSGSTNKEEGGFKGYMTSHTSFAEPAPVENKPTPVVVYLSGPMRNLPEYNYPQFDERARDLRKLGYEVINPAENFGGDTTRTFEEYMHTDLSQVLRADIVAVLPGWSDSEGARLEVQVAVATGKRVVWAHNFDDLLSEELQTPEQEAWGLVNGERGQAYGHPLDNFTKLGRMWGALLDIPDIDAGTVALMHVVGKLARETHAIKRDNTTDTHGYMIAYSKVLAEKARRDS